MVSAVQIEKKLKRIHSVDNYELEDLKRELKVKSKPKADQAKVEIFKKED